LTTEEVTEEPTTVITTTVASSPTVPDSKATRFDLNVLKFEANLTMMGPTPGPRPSIEPEVLEKIQNIEPAPGLGPRPSIEPVVVEKIQNIEPAAGLGPVPSTEKPTEPVAGPGPIPISGSSIEPAVLEKIQNFEPTPGPVSVPAIVPKIIENLISNPPTISIGIALNKFQQDHVHTFKISATEVDQEVTEEVKWKLQNIFTKTNSHNYDHFYDKIVTKLPKVGAIGKFRDIAGKVESEIDKYLGILKLNKEDVKFLNDISLQLQNSSINCNPCDLYEVLADGGFKKELEQVDVSNLETSLDRLLLDVFKYSEYLIDKKRIVLLYGFMEYDRKSGGMKIFKNI
jgi:hypothetical protein